MPREVFITDFGLAIVQDSDTDNWHGNTPLYGAPEQFEGRAAFNRIPATERKKADVFAFGMIMRELVFRCDHHADMVRWEMGVCRGDVGREEDGRVSSMVCAPP